MPRPDLTPANYSAYGTIYNIRNCQAWLDSIKPTPDIRVRTSHFSTLGPHAKAFLISEYYAGNENAVADTHDAIHWEVIDLD